MKPATVEPLAPARYKVTFTGSAELRDKLDRLQALMPDRDLAEIIEAAVSEKLERVEARRLGKTESPRKSLDETDVSAGSRHVPAAVKRAVVVRDGGRCTFVAADGRRCGARRGLEFHHDEPFALAPANGPKARSPAQPDLRRLTRPIIRTGESVAIAAPRMFGCSAARTTATSPSRPTART